MLNKHITFFGGLLGFRRVVRNTVQFVQWSVGTKSIAVAYS